MKKILIVLTLLCGLVLSSDARTLTLTSDKVTSAAEIEISIYNATKGGTEYGTVILDGKKGPFTYSRPDKSINILYSDFALKGLNGAFITNCEDGLFFDDVSVHNVTVSGIYFNCSGNGINRAGLSERKNIVIKENLFRANNFGIEMNNAVHWSISNNTIAGGLTDARSGIALWSVKDSEIESNVISGCFALRLGNYPFNSKNNEIEDNLVLGYENGIRLDKGVSSNQFEKNRIITYYLIPYDEDDIIPMIDDIGIYLAPATMKNEVIANSFCSPHNGNDITIVNEGRNNKITKNVLMTGFIFDKDK